MNPGDNQDFNTTSLPCRNRDQQGGYSFEALLDHLVFEMVVSSVQTRMKCSAYNRKAKTAMINPKYLPDDCRVPAEAGLNFASSDRIGLGLAGFLFQKMEMRAFYSPVNVRSSESA
jgi:hypothetical protein